MAFWRFMVDRKLRSADTDEYRYRRPLCQVCGQAVNRVALRELAAPYQWVPMGWICVGCSIIDVELVK